VRADGQRGWDSNVSNDAGGGGGAGGSVLLIAGSGHGNVTVQARGGDGADSNLNNTNTSIPSPTGVQGNCCGGEREGPGGGGGGGAVYANAAPGAMDLAGGLNGKSREDLFLGFSGNMQANPGGDRHQRHIVRASDDPRRAARLRMPAGAHRQQAHHHAPRAPCHPTPRRPIRIRV
jgi:hypothetical protein